MSDSDAPAGLLNLYLEARLVVSAHPDDPNPVEDAWIVLRTVELMLIKYGWTETELENAFVRREHECLLALNVEGWRTHLVDTLERRTERSLRIAQALEHYHAHTGGAADGASS